MANGADGAKANLNFPLAEGQLVGRKYRVGRLLGSGGMGSVYEAHDEETKDRVAIKLLADPAWREDDRRVARFLRELSAMRQIESPHVARVRDGGLDTATRQPFYVMDCLRGAPLDQILLRLGTVAPFAAAQIVLDACQGLAAAHAAGILHRDIKPGNLFLVEDQGGALSCQIIDFGIAKTLAPVDGVASLTESGGVVGSPHYMAPEQFFGARDLDERCDIWAIGAVFYELLSGQTPFPYEGSAARFTLALSRGAAPPLAEIAPWVPPSLIEVVDGALKADRAERYASAQAMIDALRLADVRRSVLTEAEIAPSVRRPLVKAAGPADAPKKTSSDFGVPPVSPAASTGMIVRNAAPLPLMRRGVALAFAALVALGAAAGVRMRRRGPLTAEPQTSRDAERVQGHIEVRPRSARVEVDGIRALRDEDGNVAVSGAAESQHSIRAFTEMGTYQTEVRISDGGVVPAVIDFDTRGEGPTNSPLPDRGHGQ